MLVSCSRGLDAALDAVPDGWAKVDGKWLRLEAMGTQWTCSSRCWQEGGPHDDSCQGHHLYSAKAPDIAEPGGSDE